MFHFKTQQTLMVCCALLFLTSACTGVSFSPAPITCESASTSAKFGTVPGPVILFPTSDSAVGDKVNVSGTCADGKAVEVQEVSGQVVQAECKNGLFKAEITLSAGDGSKDLMVSQKSAADGSTVVDRLCFMKDTVPPAVSINNGNSAQGTNSNTATITGTCEAGLSVVLTGPGLTTPVATECPNGSFSAVVTVLTGDGIKNIIGTQVDRAGNQGAAWSNVSIDSTPPVVKITSQIPIVTNRPTLAVTGTCEAGLPVEIGALRATTAPAVTCANGTFSANIPLPGADGPVVAQVFQVDLAGNIGFDAKNLIKDTTPPAPTIALPLANAYLAPSTTFSGTCENGVSVVLSGSVLNAAQTVACNAGQWTLTSAITSGQGAKTLIASQTDAAGNEGQSQRSFVVDTVAPVLAFTAPAANSFIGATFNVMGTCETGLAVQLTGAGITVPASTSCVNGMFSANLTASPLDGSKQVIASQTDGAGNTGSATRSFLRDTQGPLLTITSPVDGSRVGANITLTGACEAGLTINLSGAGLAGTASTVCAGNGTYSVGLTISAGDGAKAVSAREVDGSGNDTVVNVSYLRDTTAPKVAITSPAANTVAQTGLTVGGTCESGLNVILAGTGVSAAVTTACSNTGTFSAAVNFTAGEGSKLVTATQTDLSGNVGTDSRSFISDLSGPAIAITAPAANSYLPTNFAVVGSCETGVPVTVAGAGVLAPVTAACNAGTFVANVTVSNGEGAKVVTASQTDAVGNAASDTKNYLRDTVAPVITITSPANGTTAKDGVLLSGACETGLQVQITGAGVAAASTAACNNSKYESMISFSNGDGPKAVTVSQTDAAGNSGQAQGNFNRDTTPPVVAITSPDVNTSGQNGLTVGGTCETGLSVTLNGAGVATAVVTACNAGTFSAAIVFSDGNGAKLVTANQTDAVGNTGSGSRTFQRDLTPPTVAITSPAANSYLPTNFTVLGNCETGLPVTVAGSGLAAAVTANCAAGAFSAAVTVSAGDGAKVVTASQKDAVGNTATDTKNYLRDTTAPVITIASPANGTSAKDGVLLSGACETGLQVQISGAGVAAPSTTACNNSKYESNIVFSNGDGAKAVSVSQTDAAGNSGQAQGTFNRDTTPPAIAITSPAANTVGQNGLTVGGTCETGLNVTLNGAGVAAPVVTACAAGTFSAAIVFSDGNGAKLVTANQTDALGNTGSNSRSFIRDLTPPAIAITAPVANSYLPTNFMLQGTCEAGLNVTLGGAGLSAPVTTACAAGTFSATVTVSNGDGAKAVTASQADAVGNTATDTKNYLRDTLAPAITITSPVNGTVAKDGVLLSGACESGLMVQISGAGVSANTTTACNNSKYESNIAFSNGDGAKAVTVSQTDAAGNVAQAQGNFVRDTMAPVVAITSPDANTSAQNAILIGGICEPNLNVTINGAGVATPVVVTCMGGAFMANLALSPGDGPKVVTASQTDAVGNTGSGSRTFNRDLTGPAITITAPVANSFLPANFNVQGACETGLTVTLGGNGLAAAVTAACNNGTYTAAVVVSNGDGAKVVTASQTDAVGNVGTATQTYQRDTTAPVITITAPANGTTAKDGVQISGACETGLTVQISGAGVSAASTATCANSKYQSNIVFSNGDGAKAVTVSQTDAAGNSAQAQGTFNRDTTAPLVAITTPAADTAAQNGLSLGGTCEAGLNVTLNGAGVATPVVVACSAGGVFTADIVFSNGAGAKVVTASQTDAVGNSGSGSRTFQRDLTAPTVTITVPTANSYLPDSFVVQGACEAGLQVIVAGAGIAAPMTVNCAAGSYTAPVTVSSGDGAKNITAKQTDAAGNVGQASQNFLRDTTAPALAITAPANGSSVAPAVNLVGTCESGLTVSVTGDLGAATGACTNNAFNINITFTAALGTKNVKVQQTDAAGNVGQANAQFLRDSNSGTESFVSDASFGKIDILFIDDNSASMDPNQASLGTKFAGFASELLNIDWQIGITTTDCSNGAYGICGSLLSMTGTGNKILTPNTANYQTVFNNSIQRPETAGCLAKGTCPAGNSQPLLAATTAMTKHNTDNNGFFRGNSDLAIVILSDADEGQVGSAAYNNRPAQLVSTFNSIWPSDKKLKVYSIIVKPGDTACHTQMNKGSNGFSFFGNLVDQTVNLTAGISTSICAPDYTVTLKSIGESVRTLTNSVELKNTPIAGSVSVQFTPNQNITYKVIDNKVVFDSPPSVGTQITVNYRY